MHLKDYLKEKQPYIWLYLLWLLFLEIFLFLTGNSASMLLVIFLCTFVVQSATFLIAFTRRKQYLQQLEGLAFQLENRCLLADVMEYPKRADDQVFYRLLQLCNKSMLEQIAAAKQDSRAYREYIEQWIHEIKNPIAAIKLLCDAHKSELSRTILMELERVNQYAEQALFYARSDAVEKDYLIAKISLEQLIHASIAENKQLLIRNHAQIDIKDCDIPVYTDKKWIVFILNQFIINAVKYQKESLLSSSAAK